MINLALSNLVGYILLIVAKYRALVGVVDHMALSQRLFGEHRTPILQKSPCNAAHELIKHKWVHYTGEINVGALVNVMNHLAQRFGCYK